MVKADYAMFGALKGLFCAFLAHTYPAIGHTRPLPYTCAESAESGWLSPYISLYSSMRIINPVPRWIKHPAKRSMDGPVTDVAELYRDGSNKRRDSRTTDKHLSQQQDLDTR